MKNFPLQTRDSNRYPGGKNLAGVWQWLVSLMPAHAFYAEPFVGSGALLRRKPPALANDVIDSDPRVIEWWQMLAWPGTTARVGCGIAWLEEAGPALEEDALVYVDPPYQLRTRVKKRIYRQELTAADHERLLRALRLVGCRVMLSGYDAPNYRRALAGWRLETREVITRGGTLRTECLWLNFDPHHEAPASMTMAAAITLAGEGFRARERIKRKTRRWRANFVRLPHGERRAILAGLLEAEWEQRP